MTSFDWIDFSRLENIEQDIRYIFDQAVSYMDDARKSAILSTFSARLGNLMVLSQVQRPQDDQAQDLEQDQAEDYSIKMM